MTVYAESSAILAWLLAEAEEERVLEVLGSQTRVFLSELALVEVDRAFHRGVHLGSVTAAQARERREALDGASEHWSIIQLVSEVVDRARRPMPIEPVRSLDALHLATALHVRTAEPTISMLSLDERVRANALALGFEVTPQP